MFNHIAPHWYFSSIHLHCEILNRSNFVHLLIISCKGTWRNQYHIHKQSRISDQGKNLFPTTNSNHLGYQIQEHSAYTTVSGSILFAIIPISILSVDLMWSQSQRSVEYKSPSSAIILFNCLCTLINIYLSKEILVQNPIFDFNHACGNGPLFLIW